MNMEPPEKKRKTAQVTLFAYTTPNIGKVDLTLYVAEEAKMGMVQCHYERCQYPHNKWFTLPAFMSHENMHKAKGHQQNKTKPPCAGQVKIRGALYEKNTKKSSVVEDLSDKTTSSTSAMEATGLRIDNNAAESDESAQNLAAPAEPDLFATPTTTPSRRGRNFNAPDILRLLTKFRGKDPNLSKNKFCAQNKIHKSQLDRWFKNEEKISTVAEHHSTSLRRYQILTRNREGRYPEMEEQLAYEVKILRMSGIPVEAWNFLYMAKKSFHVCYPNEYDMPDLALYHKDAPDKYPIAFSDTWKRGFMKRHGFSFRKIGSRMNKKAVTPEMMQTVKDHARRMYMQCLCVKTVMNRSIIQ